MTRKTLRLAAPALLALASAVGCGAATTSSPSGGGAQDVTVAVQPATAQLLPGATLQFASVVTGTVDTAVVWSVVEAGGGTVDAGGLYHAPSAAGAYHVRATSAASSGVYAQATVTVTTAPVVAVSISPRSTSAATGAKVTFSAIVTGTSNTGVTWTVQEASGCGSITSAGVYSAPPAAATCHVVATSVADASKSDTATVTVTAAPVVTVAVSPSTAAVNGCQTVTFSATVTGSANGAVTWSVLESGGGTVSASGVYTAPSAAGTYHVEAKSQASGTATAQATVTVTDKILSVAISPATTTVATGGTVQLGATVTTTCGTFAATN